MRTPSAPRNNRTREKVGALAVLPVFFTLAGKRAVVIGGSDAAAWKAELLAASGAYVDVIAPESGLGGEMRELLVSGAAAGDITHIEAGWRDAQLAGAAVLVADVPESEAPALVALARAAAVPVNVIDQPAFCDFQFGSIVNRSPVVVGISTAGAAPILGQAVRQHIETLLPPALADWAKLAQCIRGRVLAELPAGLQRRHFWERLAERAFSGEAPTADTASLPFAPISAEGSVTLVGAGPGDASLLTVAAICALQGADVILFDDLVSGGVLELARREAKRLCVGKRGGRESCRQEDINAMMLRFARAGKQVVRLKSGDPTLFGRAGEEIEMLRAQGIPVRIVPGITAASALASRLGLSLTHRDHAQAVRFVTGHSRHGALPDTLDWAALADASITSAYYMCRTTLPLIAERLIAGGMDAQTPVCVAANISRPDEKLMPGVLADAADLAERLGPEDVSLFLVGDALGSAVATRRLAPAPQTGGVAARNRNAFLLRQAKVTRAG